MVDNIEDGLNPLSTEALALLGLDPPIFKIKNPSQGVEELAWHGGGMALFEVMEVKVGEYLLKSSPDALCSSVP